MYLAVRGKYKKGKIELLEKLEGIEEADVLVVVFKKIEEEDLTEEILEALEEVKLMRKGILPERTWREVRDGI
ncbi:hypothetical protein Dester_1368 [Desulfurobacterium thermolithotrophum DSM 11699]|uniref:Uncharacterized protein n=1 Tax=Desulfurobacterium thermolithotrophum (strain DSM 11699 / BSA) TaxID=868864 RepID=F0S1J6_DESTD|nr:hypothetical protein [Desulfurobacterium thermolithotrophum]ADY73999.1 hypothetical protein Dester_1368 [Desulfurobacterium thermolithotrophum DSM 11699]